MSDEAIAAIRAVRTAAHDLTNVCAALVGGIEMALSEPTISEVGKSTRGLSPRKLPEKLKG
jgi:hypothetical protein